MLRTLIWRNSGFGNLRKIRRHLDDYEPRYDPTVVPSADVSSHVSAEDALQSSFDPSTTEKPLEKKYYSVADYHALYLSGEVTPTAVVKGILPLICRDISPPGKHAVAWWESRIDLIMAAAEASSMRYKNK